MEENVGGLIFMTSARHEPATRQVSAHFARQPIAPDSPAEIAFSAHLAATFSLPERLGIYGQYSTGLTPFDGLMRRTLLRSMVAKLGHGVVVAAGVQWIHPQSFAIGDGVFIGSQAILQGRHDGRCVIGNRVWIGPGAYLDARDLVLEDFVGWGPGAKVLGSEHTGVPADHHIIETDLRIAPVRIGEGADIGTNAVILPGVTVGSGAIIGAGAVVTKDIAARAIVAGVPAVQLRSR